MNVSLIKNNFFSGIKKSWTKGFAVLSLLFLLNQSDVSDAAHKNSKNKNIISTQMRYILSSARFSIRDAFDKTHKKIKDNFYFSTHIKKISSLFFYPKSKEKFEAGQEVISHIKNIYDLFGNVFSPMEISHLLASAWEESRFGYDGLHQGQKGIYQIMAIVLADIVKRYEKYEPYLQGDIAQIFGFEESVPVSYFEDLFETTKNGYVYTSQGHDEVMNSEKNIALGMLYYLGIRDDIEAGNLQNFQSFAKTQWEKLQDKNGTLKEGFVDDMKRYVRAKGLEFDPQLLEKIHHDLIYDEESRKRFLIFARFNGNENNCITYAYKCMYYAKLIEDAISQKEYEEFFL